MSIDRRAFLKGSTILLGGILLQGNNRLYNYVNGNGNFREINNSIGVYNEKGGTIGWYMDSDVIIVIDSQFPDTAKNFFNNIQKKTNNKINFLFNTHHHNDHTKGNYFLKNFTNNIIAHKNCVRLQTETNAGNENNIVKANITFVDELKLTLPKEVITAKYFGQAHTGGDIVVHFENNNIAHLGDLVFNNVYPFIDNKGECSVKEWAATLERILKYFDNNTKFIFGHADSNENVLGQRDDLIRMQSYLIALYEYVYKNIKEGKTSEQIIETNTIPSFNNLKEVWEGARKMNLKATFEQIKI